MLVLKRKLKESILIQLGDQKIKITVTDLTPSAVRIGIDAGKDVKILREELEPHSDEKLP
jgi:carbon storage regulator